MINLNSYLAKIIDTYAFPSLEVNTINLGINFIQTSKIYF